MKAQNFDCMLLLQLCLAVLLSSCKDNDAPPSKPDPDEESEGVVFTNATDPRLAQLYTGDGDKITFYGERNLYGEPTKMNSYSIESSSDSTKADWVIFDQIGRYSAIYLKSGENIYFDYSLQDTITFFFTNTNNQVIDKAKIGVKSIGDGGRFAYQSVSGSQNFDDGSINIKVVGEYNNEEIAISDAKVEVQMLEHGNNGRNFFFNPSYYKEEKLYKVSIPGDVDYENPYAVNKTLATIQEGLKLACFNCNNTCFPPVVLLSQACIFLTHPIAILICEAVAAGGTFACGSKVMVDLFAELKRIGQLNSGITDAAVTVSADLKSLGIKVAPPVNISTIKNNPNRESDGYDIKIKYENAVEYFLTKGASKVWEFPVCPDVSAKFIFNIDGTGEHASQGADGCCCLDWVDTTWELSSDKRSITIYIQSNSDDWEDEVTFKILSLSNDTLVIYADDDPSDALILNASN